MNEVKIGDVLYLAIFKGGSLDFEVIPVEVCLIRKGFPNIIFHVNYIFCESILDTLLEYRLSDIGTRMFRSRNEALLSLKRKALIALDHIVNEMSQGRSEARVEAEPEENIDIHRIDIQGEKNAN